MHGDILARLQSQATLQERARQTGKREWLVLPLDPEGRRGFHRLPLPDAGDIFFDIEGDPLEDGGLEYLFGVWYLEQGHVRGALSVGGGLDLDRARALITAGDRVTAADLTEA